MEEIRSRNNPRIKLVRSLRRRKHRRELGQFLIEGIHHVGEAASAARMGLELDAIYYAPELLKSTYAHNLITRFKANAIPCYATTRDVFLSMSGRENPQGILAVARIPSYQLEMFDRQNFRWCVALVSPQDPGNVGTILRTIDAVGASGLLLLDSSVDVYHPSTVRASMGALFWYPVVHADYSQFADWAGGGGYHIYGTSASADLDYRQGGDYQQPAILLLGSERQGLPKRYQDLCEKTLALPMVGRTSSLNLAVAAGIMLYDMLSCWDLAEKAS